MSWTGTGCSLPWNDIPSVNSIKLSAVKAVYEGSVKPLCRKRDSFNPPGCLSDSFQRFTSSL